MYNLINLKELENIFVVSDLHYNHDRDFIWKTRGFNSCQEHGESLIQTWNERVTNDNIVFHLGDLIFNDPKGEEITKLISKLNFKRLYLLPGNHLSGIKQFYFNNLKAYFGDDCLFEAYPLRANFHRDVVFLPNLINLRVDKLFFVLCHFPIVSHDFQNGGAYHLCGHSHSNCAITNKDTGKGRRLDVGIESFGGPISLKFVVDYLKDRGIDSMDHPR